MTLHVRFHPSVALPAELDPFPVGTLADVVVEESGHAAGEIHCVLADDTLLAELNRRFRGREGPTDVLAFPYEPEQTEGVLGDIYVSLDRARTQAAEREEPLAREVWRLFVHGALHLSGHDHDTPQSKRAMERVQERWVKRLVLR